ncbi:hypothetical protein KM043_015892 [Ampulex compressa]|nr:hypothetical protein KM043_015892 [Ampulex compressa]
MIFLGREEERPVMRCIILLVVAMLATSCAGTFRWVPSSFVDGAKWELKSDTLARGYDGGAFTVYKKQPVAPTVHRKQAAPVTVYKKEPVTSTLRKKEPVGPTVTRKQSQPGTGYKKQPALPTVQKKLPIAPTVYKKEPARPTVRDGTGVYKKSSADSTVRGQPQTGYHRSAPNIGALLPRYKKRN